MNIFATHKDPIEAAVWLWDLDQVRGRKMIIESCQLLSMAVYRLDCQYHKKHFLYKPIKAHTNGMFVNWLLRSAENFNWLIKYTAILLFKYHKSKKIHASHKIYVEIYEWFADSKNYNQFTGCATLFVHYAQAKSKPEFSVTPEQCSDVHKAYRIYLKRQVLKDPGYWEE